MNRTVFAAICAAGLAGASAGTPSHADVAQTPDARSIYRAITDGSVAPKTAYRLMKLVARRDCGLGDHPGPSEGHAKSACFSEALDELIRCSDRGDVADLHFAATGRWIMPEPGNCA